VIVAVGTCIVLWYGARLVLQGQLTAGALVVFLLYLGKMYKPMKELSKMTDTLTKAAVGFERIAELLRTESQVVDRPGAARASRFAGRVELRDVSFSYRDGPAVLHRVSLLVEPGQHAAIVGPTGSGKSTLLALLLRLYDPTGGSVRIDGRDVGDYTLKSLRDQISLVPQDPVLFHGPLWRNIAYGRPDASRDEIVRAATLAHAHDFIMALPRGYDTIVGERGDTLSGGQRQRIAIARAVVRDAPILLLDEPSAALDAESEALVFEALTRLTQGRTTVTIAHRLATVRRAQTIFVLDEGRITGSGTHDHLLAVNPLYQRLSRLQLAGSGPAVAGTAAPS
jgi:subfamily B ATP-binding cassette protein MsbA